MKHEISIARDPILLVLFVPSPRATEAGKAEHRPGRPGLAAGESGKSRDEKAIQEAGAAFVKAYNAGDAKAIAALFTEDAESTDEDGTRVTGRQAIGESFAETFAANPGGKIEIRPDSLRFLSPEVAKEEGRSTVSSRGRGGARRRTATRCST